MTGEQHGAGEVCKTNLTGSTPALVSNYDWTVMVLKNGDVQELSDYMSKIYYDHFAPDLRAHDMLMIAMAIASDYRQLKEKYIELNKAYSKLKRDKA